MKDYPQTRPWSDLKPRNTRGSTFIALDSTFIRFLKALLKMINIKDYFFTYTYIHIYIYIYVCVCI